MKTNISLRIEKPCHENWNNMIPEEQGKFCLKCAKTVVDFTNKTKDEIIDFFKKRNYETACVRTRSDVLEQTPGLIRMKQRLARFAYLLYLVFGSFLFSCNQPSAQNNITGKIEMPRIESENPVLIGDTTIVKQVEEPKAIMKGEMIFHPKESETIETPFIPDTIDLEGVTVNSPQTLMGDVIMVSGGMSIHYTLIQGTEFQFPDTIQADNNTGFDSQLNIEQQPSLQVFPNPTAGEFSVQLKNLKDEQINLSVINITGQVVKVLDANEYTTEKNNIPVNISELASGIYFVRLETGDTAITERLILTK